MKGSLVLIFHSERSVDHAETEKSSSSNVSMVFSAIDKSIPLKEVKRDEMRASWEQEIVPRGWGEITVFHTVVWIIFITRLVEL